MNSTTLKDAKEQATKQYAKLVCPHCSTELIIETTNLRNSIIPFNPKEEEYTYYQLVDDSLKEFTGKRLVSTDHTKDVCKIVCCNCGHRWDEPVNNIYKNQCDYKGDQHFIFELDDVETEHAKQFIEEHGQHCCGDKPFTALGMQFTYTFTPGGLGSLVNIKCNKCGKSKDITNIESW